MDKTSAEYWGFQAGEFDELIFAFDGWFRQKLTITRDVSFDVWWDDDDTQRNEKVIRTVGVANDIRLTIGLSNRYRFSVHLDHAVLSAQYEGDDTDVSPPYRIGEVVDKGIPGSSTNTTYLSFEFLPLAIGKFTVNAFKKNYWGYVDTQIACGPLVFNAIAAYPQLTMEVLNFPAELFAGQCEPIEIRITNTGDSHLRGFALVIDHPESFSCDLPLVLRFDRIIIIQHLEPVPVSAVVTIPLVLRAGDAGSAAFHFFTAVVGVRCAFLLKKMVIREAAHFETRAIAVGNDTANVAYHLSVRSQIEGLEVVGLINRKNHFVRTVALSPETILSPGQTATLVAFTSDESTTAAESWRITLMGHATFAVLYCVPNVSLLLQRNVRIEERPLGHRLVLSMPSQARVVLGKRVNCSLHLVAPSSDDLVLYVEPLPFRFTDIGLQSRNEPYVGCRWVGVTRKAMSRESQFKCEFSFVAHTSGIFELPGFRVSTKADRTNETQVWLSQMIQIIPA
jgi:hypothetical protein